MNFQALVDVLPLIGKGMLGIFCVVGVIIASVYVLQYFAGKKSSKEE